MCYDRFLCQLTLVGDVRTTFSVVDIVVDVTFLLDTIAFLDISIVSCVAEILADGTITFLVVDISIVFCVAAIIGLLSSKALKLRELLSS